MSNKITIRCRNCGTTITYNLRNGAKPSKICNKCDTKGVNKKTDLSSPINQRKQAKFMRLY